VSHKKKNKKKTQEESKRSISLLLFFPFLFVSYHVLMKKILFLGLGFLTAVSAWMLSSHAGVQSRYWRYTYRQSTNCDVCPSNSVDPKLRYVRNGCCDRGRVRSFSNRIGTFKYRRPTRKEILHDYLDYSHPSRRHDVWQHAQYRETELSRRVRIALNRVQNPKLYPRNENTLGTSRLVVRNGDYKELSPFAYEPTSLAVYRPEIVRIKEVQKVKKPVPYQSYTRYLNEDYTLEIPAGFIQKSNTHYESVDNTVSFRVVRTPGDYACVQQSFEECAIALGKEFKDEQNLVQVSQMQRDVRWNQTVGEDFVHYPTMTETFHANGFGTHNAYLIFNALDPRNGSVVRIEAVSKSYDTNIASETMKKVFQSFRFQL
jgi:hypothetical protein